MNSDDRKKEKTMVKKNKRRIAAIIIMMTLMISVCAPASFAASSKKTLKMTVYSDVIKKGNAVYCMAYNTDCGLLGKLYKVDLKTSRTTKLSGRVFCPRGMSYKGGYVYYSEGNSDTQFGKLYRVRPGTKKKYLAPVYLAGGKCTPVFVLGKNKIYYKEARHSKTSDKVVMKYRQMKLNGKGKKALTNSSIKMTRKKTSAKGYSLVYVGVNGEYDDEYDYWSYEYYNCYLRTPDGRRIFVTRLGED